MVRRLSQWHACCANLRTDPCSDPPNTGRAECGGLHQSSQHYCVSLTSQCSASATAGLDQRARPKGTRWVNEEDTDAGLWPHERTNAKVTFTLIFTLNYSCMPVSTQTRLQVGDLYQAVTTRGAHRTGGQGPVRESSGDSLQTFKTFTAWAAPELSIYYHY